ncbi:ABC transporter substrate-binding protein [Halovulum dunhuangense]|uniref:ABC transporter substrate-binding protein n=1 Tax=Halovulum dunhuangense TaxID=1505036 RepID=A0A849L678_9RHOB|nr:ABC transporter substrate-binding protein [Halovulum dunhuangense]NNU81640.1 ABC transporter substrate-binding protein [Halovulum dunhuangense]
MTSDLFRPGRRGFLTVGLAAAGVALVPLRASALTTNEATALIQQAVDELMAVVNSNASESQAIGSFERIFARYADVPVIARSVLGQPWRSASAAQQNAFVAAFQSYLARKYGAEFREYRGAQFNVTGARDEGDRGILVSAAVTFPGSAPIRVDWQVSDRSGSPRLFNLFIEGVSMLSTERSEVRAILEANRNSIDGLIADLRSRG